MDEVRASIERFLKNLSEEGLDVYNEFSLQHELGIHLRHEFLSRYRIQFERPVDTFGLDRQLFAKREIDIVMLGSSGRPNRAIELKFPRAGQHPEQMFKACQDIYFIEQLTRGGFSTSFFLMLVEDQLFYRGDKVDGIYAYFRGGKAISGLIRKPTGKQDDEFQIAGSYEVKWKQLGTRRYALVEVLP